MSPKGTGDPEELEASRDARVAARRRAKVEQYVAALRRAEHLRVEGGGPTAATAIRDLIGPAESELRTLQRRAGGPVFSRRRPKKRPEAGSCWVFLDECGSHELSAPDPYPVFALSAVIVPDTDYPNVEARWHGWKAELLGQHDAVVHEPTVRNRLGLFGGPEGPEVTASLTTFLGELDFKVLPWREEYEDLWKS